LRPAASLPGKTIIVETGTRIRLRIATPAPFQLPLPAKSE
jgi:hypothetical protein